MGEQKPNITVSLDKSDVEGKDDTKETIQTEEDENDGENTVTQGEEEDDDDGGEQKKKGFFSNIFLVCFVYYFGQSIISGYIFVSDKIIY